MQQKSTTPKREATLQAGERLGTVWVAPGEGSPWRELYEAFNYWSSTAVQQAFPPDAPIGSNPDLCRTNLLLTGAPIQDYDRQRWESGNVK